MEQLTLDSQLHLEALGGGLGPVLHHAADVPAVVLRPGDHPVLAGDRHRVVGARLGHGGGVAVGRGHPGDLGRRAAVGRLAARHHHRLRVLHRRHHRGQVLGLSWWVEEGVGGGQCGREKIRGGRNRSNGKKRAKGKIMCIVY